MDFPMDFADNHGYGSLPRAVHLDSYTESSIISGSMFSDPEASNINEVTIAWRPTIPLNPLANKKYEDVDWRYIYSQRLKVLSSKPASVQLESWIIRKPPPFRT